MSLKSQISRRSTHEGGQVVSRKHRPTLPPRKYFWYSFDQNSSRRPVARTFIRPKKTSNRIKLESFALYKLNRACILTNLIKSEKM